MAKRFNIRDVLKAHTDYKCALLKTYKHLAEQNKKKHRANEDYKTDVRKIGYKGDIK